MFANLLILVTMMLLLLRTLVGFQDDLVTRCHSLYVLAFGGANATNTSSVAY